MYNNKKREYTSPEMEILNARVERGFEGSANAFNNPTSNDSYTKGESIGHKFN
jgi:hypothetical protein